MNYVNKMVKVTLFSAVVLGFIGCDDGACCTSDISSTDSSKYKVPDATLKGNSVEIPTIRLVPKGNPTTPTINNKGNKPPVAVIYTNKDDVEVATTSKCKAVKFSAEGSYDNDGDVENLRYSWTDLHGKYMSDKEKFKHKFSKKGLYEVTLTVTDEQNLTAIDKVCILSGLDTMPLVADAGKDITVTKDENITLSGRAVCRDDIASYEWKEHGSKLSDKPTFSTSKLPVGEHTLKLIVTDFAGERTCDKVKVTVK